MNEEALARHAAQGLEKCLLKLTAVSPGEWRLAGARIYHATVREALRREERRAPHCSAIRVKLKGDAPFTTVLLFDPEDSRHISRCFVSDHVSAAAAAEQADMAGMEVANIVLNALINALLRAFGRSAASSVPAYFRGDMAGIENWLGAGPGAFTVISVRFSMQRDGRAAHAEALAFLPPAFMQPL